MPYLSPFSERLAGGALTYASMGPKVPRPFPTTVLQANAAGKKRQYQSSASSRRGNLVMIKNCMRRLAEKKHLTTSINQAPVLAAGAIQNLVIMSQGTSASTRTGMQIHLSEVSLLLTAQLAATNAVDTIRVILGFDSQSDGAAPGVTDVLESTSWVAPYNKDKVKPFGRFTILMDRTIDVCGQSATVTQQNKSMRFSQKLDRTVYYQSNAGTISDLLKNNLFCLQIGFNGTGTTAGNVQVCYTDL